MKSRGFSCLIIFLSEEVTTYHQCDYKKDYQSDHKDTGKNSSHNTPGFTYNLIAFIEELQSPHNRLRNIIDLRFFKLSLLLNLCFISRDLPLSLTSHSFDLNLLRFTIGLRCTAIFTYDKFKVAVDMTQGSAIWTFQVDVFILGHFNTSQSERLYYKASLM